MMSMVCRVPAPSVVSRAEELAERLVWESTPNGWHTSWHGFHMRVVALVCPEDGLPYGWHTTTPVGRWAGMGSAGTRREGRVRACAAAVRADEAGHRLPCYCVLCKRETETEKQCEHSKP